MDKEALSHVRRRIKHIRSLDNVSDKFITYVLNQEKKKHKHKGSDFILSYGLRVNAFIRYGL